MRQRIESLEQFRALQAEYMAAREAEKLTPPDIHPLTEVT